MHTTSPSPGASGTLAGAADGAHLAVDKVAEKVAPALERAASAAHRTIDRAAEAVAPAAAWASEGSQQLVARSNALAETCGNQVRARPFVALAAAAGIGYLVGKLAR